MVLKSLLRFILLDIKWDVGGGVIVFRVVGIF